MYDFSIRPVDKLKDYLGIIWGFHGFFINVRETCVFQTTKTMLKSAYSCLSQKKR